MTKMKGARAFLECLKMEGVKYIFGNPGTTEVPLLDALCDFPEITYVLALQESVAVGMADGYTREAGMWLWSMFIHPSGRPTQSGSLHRVHRKITGCGCHREQGHADSGRNSFCEVPTFPE